VLFGYTNNLFKVVGVLFSTSQSFCEIFLQLKRFVASISRLCILQLNACVFQVPIIKLTDQLSQVKVDIGFNIGNSQRSAELVQVCSHEITFLSSA